MKKLLLLLVLVQLHACGSSKKETEAEYSTELKEVKKITLPVDENTYYMSRSIFQFEEDGREFLHFQNTDKQQYEIIIYDIAEQKISKRIPLKKEGANAIPAIFGSRPWGDSNSILFFQNNVSRITIGDTDGIVIRKYNMRTPDNKFIAFFSASNFYTPSFVKDSVIYISPDIPKPDMKKEDWENTPMFFSLDLRSGKTNWLPIHYPPIFNQNMKNLAGGASFSYDYNYKHNRLVCSFTGYDSLLVSDDLRTTRQFDGKSRYLKSIRPTLVESAAGISSLVKLVEMPAYHNIMYDKYRDVYYRFVKMPYELQPNESPFNEIKAREFSVIILNKDFRIIGETKFPGNKYFYKMSFVGRDGLYISENNLANPDFDEDKLVFACFKLEDLKGK